MVGATPFGMLGLLRPERIAWPRLHADESKKSCAGATVISSRCRSRRIYQNHCGGDYFVHSDNNRWTDNVPDGRDDRIIDTRPCDTIAQWLFVLAEAGMARLVRNSDPAYSRACGAASRRCLGWLLEKDQTGSAGEIGVALAALVELHRLEADPALQEQMTVFAGGYCACKSSAGNALAPVWAFLTGTARHTDLPGAYKPIQQGCWPLLGLSALLSASGTRKPERGQSASACSAAVTCSRWRNAMLSGRAIRPVPQPAGQRPAGRFWYRYFYEEPAWCVGINANLLHTLAGRLLMNHP
jgi:hypothetical protein